MSQSETSSQCAGDSPVCLEAQAGACQEAGRLIVFEMPELQLHRTLNVETPAQPTVSRHTISLSATHLTAGSVDLLSPTTQPLHSASADESAGMEYTLTVAAVA